jgi:hypothetical protein
LARHVQGDGLVVHRQGTRHVMGVWSTCYQAGGLGDGVATFLFARLRLALGVLGRRLSSRSWRREPAFLPERSGTTDSTEPTPTTRRRSRRTTSSTPPSSGASAPPTSA